jgi:hypothetical protein
MHDGPAQSLTNIVLQAQIVERLLATDPELARAEVRQLVSMVQQTLDATKSFIFDVRPMVLDDLGLVPTLRRAARERGRRSGVAVDFESMGADRRLSMELESGLFRVLDEAISGYLASAPDRVSVRLDWSEDRVGARISATRRPSAKAERSRRRPERDLPPALAAMMDERRADARDRRIGDPGSDRHPAGIDLARDQGRRPRSARRRVRRRPSSRSPGPAVGAEQDDPGRAVGGQGLVVT